MAPRKRKTANAQESKLGIKGTTTAAAADMFTNAMARMGYGTPSLGQGASYELVRLSYDYWQLITLFRNHWISRRIVEVPAQDMIKAWPKLTSDIEPKDITRIDCALRKTNTKNNLLTALTWARLFGGAGGLMVIKGQENELDQPLDLDAVEIGGYKGVIPFDRWAGISPLGDVCTDIERPLDFNKPEMYEVRITGGNSFKVHSSRLLRFLGPTVPTPELEAQSYWGISVLEPTYESITKLDNMSWNILSLTFRANILGMKFPELAQLLSGLGSSQLASEKFAARMSAVNHLISNQSLVPLPTDGSIESTAYRFGGLAEIFQLFQLDLSGASQIPVARLWGRTYSGLGQTGDGDERIYEEKIATDQATYLLPQLEKLFPVICMSELGEVPEDLDLICPSIRVLDEKEKAELAKSVADTTTVYLNGGIMSPRVVGREVKQSSDVTGIGTNLTEEEIAKLPDTVQSEGELGEGLFGGEGAGLNEASSPAKAIKEENKAGKQEEEGNNPGPSKEVKPVGTAPAMDIAPANLKPGEKLLVNGKLLTVKHVAVGTTDLFDEPTVQVQFTTGEIIAYRPDSDLQLRNADKSKATDIDWDHATVEQLAAYYVRKRMKPEDARRKAAMVAEKRELAARYMAQGMSRAKAQARALKEQESRTTDADWGIPSNYRAALRLAKALDEDGPSTLHKGMQLYHGLPVRVETAAGGKRSGVTPQGKQWAVNMPASYGFVEGIKGADGDSLDCYVGLSPESSNVYVVDQLTLDGKQFDEHKVMLAYHTAESAEEDYRLGHHASNKTFGGMTAFTMPMFRRWMAEADLTQPCGSEVRS